MGTRWIVTLSKSARRSLESYCSMNSKDDASYEQREQELYDWFQELAEQGQSGDPTVDRFFDRLRSELLLSARGFLGLLRLEQSTLGQFLLNGLQRLLRDAEDRGAARYLRGHRIDHYPEGFCELLATFALYAAEICVLDLSADYYLAGAP